MNDTTSIMTTREAARYLNISATALNNSRLNPACKSYKPRGPKFVRLFGRVRYLKEDLDAWLEEQRR